MFSKFLQFGLEEMLGLISIPHDGQYAIGIDGYEQRVPFQRQPQHPAVGVKVRKEDHAPGAHDGHDS